MPENGQKCWDDTIKAIRGGDLNRFRDIVSHFQEKLRFVVAYHIRGDADKIDELVHCAFVAAYESLDRFEVGKPMGPWLKTIAKNEALKEVRRLSRQAKLKRKLLDTAIARSKSNQDAVLSKVDELRRCIEKLSGDARQLVQMHYFERTDYKTMAGKLERSSGGLRVAMLEIRRGLRDCIDRQAVP